MTAILVTLLSLGSATFAHAQDRGAAALGGSGVLAGASIPTGAFADIAGTGFHVGAFHGIPTRGGRVGLRVDALYHQFGVRQTRADIPNTSVQYFLANRYRVLSGALNAVAQPWTGSSRVRPYVSVGAGGYLVMTTVASTGVPCAGFECLPPRAERVYDGYFGVNGGAGIRVGDERRTLFVEGRYHHLFETSVVHDCTVRTQCNRIPTTMAPVSIGVTLHF